MTIDVTIIVALITGACGVLGTWLTMRAQIKAAEASVEVAVKSAEAVIIEGYSKLVDDLRSEIDRLNVRQGVLEKQHAYLEGVVKEREQFIERLTIALGNTLNGMAPRNGG